MFIRYKPGMVIEQEGRLILKLTDSEIERLKDQKGISFTEGVIIALDKKTLGKVFPIYAKVLSNIDDEFVALIKEEGLVYIFATSPNGVDFNPINIRPNTH